MKIFLVEPLAKAGNYVYRTVFPVIPNDEPDLWSFDGRLKYRDWTREERACEFLEPNLPLADFPPCTPTSALAVVNPDALAVTHIIERCAELLPVRAPGLVKVVLVNVVPAEPCLDLERTVATRLSDGRLLHVARYEFVAERLPARSLFKSAEDPYPVFALQGTVGQDDDFKSVVEREALSGLDFREIWNDDGDPVETLVPVDFFRTSTSLR